MNTNTIPSVYLGHCSTFTWFTNVNNTDCLEVKHKLNQKEQFILAQQFHPLRCIAMSFFNFTLTRTTMVAPLIETVPRMQEIGVSLPGRDRPTC